jgi:hypothetical protein
MDISQSLAHYESQEVTEAGIRELLKSMEANEGVSDLSLLTGASALQPQSLEASVVSLLFDETYFKVLNRVAKAKEYSTLAEYTQRTSYGNFNRGGFVNQSENPRQADPSFKRKVENIKFLRELWSVSSVLASSRTITDPEIDAVDASTLRLMETAERGYFLGDSSIVPEEWNGLLATVKTYGTQDQIVDMRGETFTERILKDNCKNIAQRGNGLANDMYMSYGVQNQIDNLLSGVNNQRYSQNDGTLTFDLGHIINGFKATFAKNGRIDFVPDYFLNTEEEGVPTIQDTLGNIIEGATSDLSPATPAVSLNAGIGAQAGSKWLGTGSAPAGVVYQYRVSARSRHGASKASAIVAETPVIGSGIELTITDNSVSNFADAYDIYREVKTGPYAGTIKKMVTIAKDKINPTTVFIDLNLDLPGTSVAFLGDFNSRGADGPLRTTKVKELAPFHKTRYSIIGPYFWGAVNYYATPVFYAPRKFVVFKNIGLE